MGSEGEREATRPKVVEKGQNFCNGMDAAAAAAEGTKVVSVAHKLVLKWAMNEII